MTLAARYASKAPNRSMVTRLDVIAALESALIALRDCEANTGFKTGMAQLEIQNVLKRLERQGYDSKAR